MSDSLASILVVDDDVDTCHNLQDILTDLGYQVDVAHDGLQALQKVRHRSYDVALLDLKMPDMDGIEAATRIYQDEPVPVILVSAYHDTELIRRAEVDHVRGYLVKPVKQADLEPVIALAMRRFDQLQELRREASDLRQALEDRKLIERAKGSIMKRSGLAEPDAFRRLQKVASDRNLKLVEAARLILTAEEAFQP